MNINEDQVPVNYFETVGVATAAGSVLLALLGAAAGALMSSKNRGQGAAQGAIIGGVAGAGLGAVSGVQTAEQKKYYAVQLARYDCQLEAARAENAELTRASQSLQASVGTLTRQLDQLEDDYANKRLTKVQAQQELAAIDESSAALKTRLVAMKADTDEYEKYAAQTQQQAQGTQRKIDEAKVDELDRQIAEMRDRNEDLEREYDQLVERRKAVVLQ
jgi:chromosome segregation ATPase